METGLGKPSIPFLAFGTKFIDLNLDGWLDIFVANGHVIDNINLINKKYQHAQHNQVYMNKKNSTFEDKTYDIGGDLTQKPLVEDLPLVILIMMVILIISYQIIINRPH